MLWPWVTEIVIIALPLLLPHDHYGVLGEEADEINEIIHDDVDYGKTWMFIPDGDGNAQIAYLKDPGPHHGVESSSSQAFGFRNGNGRGVTYYLYRKAFPTEPVMFRVSDRSYLRVLNNPSNFDPDLDTKMVIHGWKNTYKSNIGQKIKDAYLKQDDMNVIVVDWAELADDSLYFKSAEATRDVGTANAMLLDYVVTKRGAKLEDIHIVGHSLGAQTAGFTGASMKSGKPARITGLDPAMPGFTEPNNNNRLDPSDAEFVDVIHTCAGILGSNEPLGHVDFWPNGGKMAQPGCSSISDIIGACSHGRSYEYYTDSIENEIPFRAYPCKDYETFKKGQCSDGVVEMGEGTPSEARGSYFLMTRAKKPFALLW